MSNVTNNVIVNSFAEAQEAASLINFTVRRLEQRINDSICDAYELHDENTRLKQRIKRLEEFARTIERDFDHDEDAHRYGTTCRVCYAEDLLKENKAKEDKP